MVGSQIVGAGHICPVRVPCEVEGCPERGRYLIEAHGEKVMSCADHIDGRMILGCQPGRRLVTVPRKPRPEASDE
jgi:hypothetical protein